MSTIYIFYSFEFCMLKIKSQLAKTNIQTVTIEIRYKRPSKIMYIQIRMRSKFLQNINLNLVVG